MIKAAVCIALLGFAAVSSRPATLLPASSLALPRSDRVQCAGTWAHTALGTLETAAATVVVNEARAPGQRAPALPRCGPDLGARSDPHLPARPSAQVVAADYHGYEAEKYESKDSKYASEYGYGELSSLQLRLLGRLASTVLARWHATAPPPRRSSDRTPPPHLAPGLTTPPCRPAPAGKVEKKEKKENPLKKLGEHIHAAVEDLKEKFEEKKEEMECKKMAKKVESTHKKLMKAKKDAEKAEKSAKTSK
jgi:hypothetical protein